MKMKKLLRIIITLIFALLVGVTISKAASGGPLYLGLKGKSTARATGEYSFLNKSVFKIVKFNSSGTTENDDGTVIFCVKAGAGFGSESYSNDVISYTQYFDIKSSSFAEGTQDSYRNQLPTNMTTYNQLVWVLDHLYNPENESMDDFLERTGIWRSSDFRNGTIPANEVRDIVESIEQVAIWYFTNPSGEYHNPYTNTLELYVDSESLIDKYGLDIVDNEIDTIYTYFVEGAITAVRGGYTYNSNTVNPVTLNSNSVTTTIEGNNYIIGPYTIERNNDTAYTLSATVTDGTSNISNVKILDRNKSEITQGSTIGEKINSTVGNNFYLSVPVNTDIEKVRLEISVSTRVNTPLLWTVGANELAINQPVVVIDEVNKSYSSSSEVTLPNITGSYNFKLIKQDALNQNKLNGARFSIRVNNGQTTTYTTNSSGEITINGISITDISSNDTITITEIEAPDGYILNSTPITLTITKSLQNGRYVASNVTGNSNASLTTGVDGINTVQITVDNTKITGSYNFKIIKEDKTTGETLGGAIFAVKVNNEEERQIETNSSGEISIEDIAITDTNTQDTITIREIQPPDEYSSFSGTITLKVDKIEENGKYTVNNVKATLEDGTEHEGVEIVNNAGKVTVEVTIPNEKIEGSYNLKLIKQDETTTQKLQGVKFNINVNGEGAKEYTTNSNGEIQISGIKIEDTTDDTIVIEEIETINGYILNEEPITIIVKKTEIDGQYKVESVSMSKPVGSQDIAEIIGENTVQVTLNNTRKTGSYNLKLIKQDAQNSQKLEGVKFRIKVNGEGAQEYTTNANGEIEISNIEITNTSNDTIVIEEIETLEGYILNSNPITLTVSKEEQENRYVASNVTGSNNANLVTNPDGVNTVEIIVNNTNKDGSYNLKLIKQDATTTQKLQGVKFNININEKGAREYTTNSNGEVQINDIIITDTTDDTIVIEEIETLEGYILNNEPITLTISKEEQSDKYVASNVTSNVNDGLVESGSVNITQGSNGVNTVNITVNNSTLSGSYKLKLIKQDSSNQDKLLGARFNISINRGSAQEYTTDSNGEININSIQITNVSNPDTITITEIEAPDGYVLDNTPIELTVIKEEQNGKYVASNVTGSNNANLTTSQDGVNTVNIAINNTKITGNYDFRIIKEDKTTGEKLGGAIFAVKVNNEEETQVETDKNGEISINDIAITDTTSQDTITIREVKPPDEYSSFEGTIILKIDKIEDNGKYLVNNVEATLDGETNYDDIGLTNIDGNMTVQVKIPNEKVEGLYNLKIIKQDENDESKKLKGATFDITTSVNGEESTHSYITNENGEINITNPINANDEHYRLTITETIAPTGYDTLITEPIIIDAYSTITNEQYMLENITASPQNTNWSFDEETNTITITITNRKQPFDLALRKYITHINGNAVETSREPQISEDEAQSVANGEGTFDDGTTAEKTHTKTPLIVKTGNIVRYTIRIYNEGKIDGYAKEITDYLPEGLELVPASESSINAQYGWTANGREVTTTYLADTLIRGTGSNVEENDGATNGQTPVSNLDYVDVQIECRVVRRASDERISLKNVAEITEAEDILGGTEDVDSTPDNLTEEEKNNYNPGTSEEGKGYEDDDDYEELIMEPTYFDLSLRKFITGVNDREVTNRIPEVDTSPLLNGETTANYNHTKEPVEVKKGDEVIYTIRVYNEGQVDGYVEKIVDHLPPELEFLPNDELNQEYGWTQTDERTIETDYLRNTLLTAFDGGNELDYADIQVKCRVRDSAEYLKEITNIAEITEYRNELDIPDRDNENEVVLPSDEDLPNYRDEEIERGDEYIPGQEDDDDFEKVILKQFDLALRKFITGVNDEEITNRIPQVDTSLYGTEDENGNIITSFTYNHTKEPVRVCQNDIVIYTIRIYNEGNMSGYAEEIKDDVPEGLIFLPENEVNQEYRWVMYDANGNVTENAEEAVYIRTDYLSKENEETLGENLIQAYDKDTMETPDYKDVRVAFRVTEPNTSDRIIINRAEISEDADENGEEVEDIDSTPDEWIDGEDDQDIEKIYVQYFDLALRKWVSQVILIEDGVEKVKDTGHYAEQDPEPVVRVDLNQDRIDNTIIKFRYQIRITNEGEIPGYATEISDYIPEGLEFNQADNPGWREVDGKVVTDALKDTLLEPGESAVVEIVLTWINDEENMGVMINTAEISEDYNESETPDIDSTPNNKVEGEDDIDDAPVALTMVTGSAPLYIGITAGTLAIIAGGVFLIKRYVI